LLPFVMEAHGRWGESARKFFKFLIHEAASATGVPKSNLSIYWRQRLVGNMRRAMLGLASVHRPSPTRASKISMKNKRPKELRILNMCDSLWCHEPPVAPMSFPLQNYLESILANAH
jgi:hypothetical protein